MAKNTNNNKEQKYLVKFRDVPGAKLVGKSQTKTMRFPIKPYEREFQIDQKGNKIPIIPRRNYIKLENGDGIIIDQKTYDHYTTNGDWMDEPTFNNDTQKWTGNRYINIEKYNGDDEVGTIHKGKYKLAPADMNAVIKEFERESTRKAHMGAQTARSFGFR